MDLPKKKKKIVNESPSKQSKHISPCSRITSHFTRILKRRVAFVCVCHAYVTKERQERKKMCVYPGLGGVCQSKLGGIWSEDFHVWDRGHSSYLGWKQPAVARHGCSEASLWDRRMPARPQIIIGAGKALSSYIPHHSHTYTQTPCINVTQTHISTRSLTVGVYCICLDK